MLIWFFIFSTKFYEIKRELNWEFKVFKRQIIKNVFLFFGLNLIGVFIAVIFPFKTKPPSALENLGGSTLEEVAILGTFGLWGVYFLFAKRITFTVVFIFINTFIVFINCPIWLIYSVNFVLLILANGLTQKSFNRNIKPLRPLLNSMYLWIFFSITTIAFSVLFEIHRLKEPIYPIEMISGFSYVLQLLPFFLIGKYFLITIILNIAKQLPFNLLPFLREMDARHIFESPGGSWRFRHKILQDYFIQEYERMEREGVLPN